MCLLNTYFWYWRTFNVTKFILHLSSFFRVCMEIFIMIVFKSVDEVTCFYNLSFFIIVPLSNYTFAYNTNRMLWARQDIFLLPHFNQCANTKCACVKRNSSITSKIRRRRRRRKKKLKILFCTQCISILAINIVIVVVSFCRM